MNQRDIIILLAPAALLCALLLGLPATSTLLMSAHQGELVLAPTLQETEQTVFGGITRKTVQQSLVPQLTPYGTPLLEWTYTGSDNLIRSAAVASEITKSSTNSSTIPILPSSLADGSGNPDQELLSGLGEQQKSLWFQWSSLLSAAAVSVAAALIALPIVILLALAAAFSVSKAQPLAKKRLSIILLLPLGVAPIIGVYLIPHITSAFSSTISMALANIGVPIGKEVDLYAALAAQCLYLIWQNVPIAFLVIYAGFSAIPQTTIDAAVIDGAKDSIIWQMLIKSYLYGYLGLAAVLHLAFSIGGVESFLVLYNEYGIVSLQSLGFESFQNRVGAAGYDPFIAATISVLLGVMLALICIPSAWRTLRPSRWGISLGG